MSGMGAATRAGFALAAVLLDDRALSRVEARLDPEETRAIRALCALDDGDRATLVKRLLTFVRRPLERLPAQLPLRARALLTSQLPREVARALSASAPLLRAGYTPADDLLPRLLRIARRSIELEEEPR